MICISYTKMKGISIVFVKSRRNDYIRPLKVSLICCFLLGTFMIYLSNIHLYLNKMYQQRTIYGSYKFMYDQTWIHPYNRSASNVITVSSINKDIGQNPHTNIGQEPVSNIYYVKVHKTGSTTLQNIINRFGVKHKLLFTRFNCKQGMPYPHPAYSKYFMNDPFHRHYNIMTEHAQFLPEAFKSYMVPETKVISMIRHPLDHLKSTLSFFNLITKMRLRSSDFVSEFLSNPGKYDAYQKHIGSSAVCGPLKNVSYTKNNMAYHFGLSNQSENRKDVLTEFIKELDKNISIMMILEKFDESLILLKREFHWTMQDIIYIPIWSIQFHGKKDVSAARSKTQTESLIAKHKQWSNVDYMLYNYYNDKLSTKLTNQDSSFWKEVTLFKNVVLKVRTFCTEMCYIDFLKLKDKGPASAAKYLSNYTLLIEESEWNDDFAVTYLDCVKMLLATLDYQAAITTAQLPSVCDLPLYKRKHLKIDSTFCRKDSLFYTMSWYAVRQQLFLKRSQCLKYFK